jgi:hypothetical protein
MGDDGTRNGMNVRHGAGDVVVMRLDRNEVVVLRTMVEALIEVCNDPSFGPALAAPGPGGAADDLLTMLEASWSAPAGQAPSADPAARRLFPDACPTDVAVSADFRRLTLGDQRLAKIAAADTVRLGLDGVDARGRVRVPPQDQAAWLSTLTAMRLVLAARLGIVADGDEDRFDELGAADPNYWMYNVYLWLAWLQEAIVECLTNR